MPLKQAFTMVCHATTGAARLIGSISFGISFGVISFGVISFGLISWVVLGYGNDWA